MGGGRGVGVGGSCCDANTFLAPALNLARTITLLLLMTLIPSLIFLLKRTVACCLSLHARLIFSSSSTSSFWIYTLPPTLFPFFPQSTPFFFKRQSPIFLLLFFIHSKTQILELCHIQMFSRLKCFVLCIFKITTLTKVVQKSVSLVLQSEELKRLPLVHTIRL